MRRNADRFPSDFRFELADSEVAVMVSQNVIPGLGKLGGARPMAVAEQGVAMLSIVLRTRRAVQVNLAIMRAFVRLHEMLLTSADVARKLADLERKYGSQFKAVFDAIRQLMAPPSAPPKPEIGFHVKENSVPYRVKRK